MTLAKDFPEEQSKIIRRIESFFDNNRPYIALPTERVLTVDPPSPYNCVFYLYPDGIKLTDVEETGPEEHRQYSEIKYLEELRSLLISVCVVLGVSTSTDL